MNVKGAPVPAEKEASRRAWAEWTLGRGGGIMACGTGLGVFVAKAPDMSKCPIGWVFVDVETSTVDQLVEALEHASQGRRTWPKNAKEGGSASTADDPSD